MNSVLAQRIAALSPAKQELFARGLPGRSSPGGPPRFARAGVLSPLSWAQERIWFLDRMQPGQPSYSIAGAAGMRGRLNVAALRAALSHIVIRHEILRSTFPLESGQPLQRVHSPTPAPVPVIDLAAIAEPARTAEYERFLHAEARAPFNPLTGPLFRVRLLRLAPEQHVLQYTLHHLVADGWSLGVLMEELSVLYPDFAAGREPSLAPLSMQYSDFAIWQRQRLDRHTVDEEAACWCDTLRGAPSVLSLRGARPRPPVPTGQIAAVPFRYSAKTTDALKATARREGATLFMLLLAALAAALFARRAGDDLVIGAPVAGRDLPGAEPLIGCFVNALALRVDLSGDPTIRELIERIRRICMAAYARQEVPFDCVVDQLQPQRSLAHAPVFQVVLNLQENALPHLALPDLELYPITMRPLAARYDLNLFVGIRQGCIAGSLEYRSDLFDSGYAASLMADIERAAELFEAEPGRSLEGVCSQLAGSTGPAERMVPMPPVPTLAGVRRRAVRISSRDLVRSGPLSSENPLPLLAQPGAARVDLAEWVRGNPDWIASMLSRDGAILFRGFTVPAAAFAEIAAALAPGMMPYVEGSSPRLRAGDKIYTSTEYPPEYEISMHSELSYAHRWPGRLVFHCQTAPSDGGETPLADNRAILAALDPALIERFRRFGVRYLRHLRGGRGPGLSWQSVFETEDRKYVERYCAEAGIQFRWMHDGGISTVQDRPALRRHPGTTDEVWFNQVDQWHPSNLGAELGGDLCAVSSPEQLPIHARHSYGGEIDPADLDAVRAAYRRIRVTFPWQAGDVLLVDNMLVAHGRMPFHGPRRILVAMGSPLGAMEEKG